ncbi:SDR family NAD(P)-dependent oxidoreductase [Perlucidibaca aquatica]|uniref:SDR family NAD(P)-dependent oxidoreductase n=1 Tax=Perlucidibaca aquatica TaxID=1852776 RepID=UPI00083B4B34|nr:SDR family oxidoreductase [Perlucidibaca aquatica]
MSLHWIVSGAASGIGHELAKQLLARGDRVCACDVQPAGLQALKALAGASAQLRVETLDVRDAEAWKALVVRVEAEDGAVDVLANIAGVLKENWVQDATAAEVDFHFDINVKGVIFGTQAVLPSMLARGQGHIINIASLAGLSPVPGIGLYSASKFAVRGYSLVAAMELADKGIAVTAVCPDAVQTPMLDIQQGKPQTALTFSGPRALTAQEVVAAILGPVLRDRPFEIALPAWRGTTAKLAGNLPQLGNKAIGLFRKAGEKRQKLIQAGKSSTER